ncbi:ABC transporter substrate-binding protein [Aestuariispira ectoiniformans]|uniref:ABC transporter substrate-binding protein n=1 Tax=Aestuariispira ectoiniformans TaxID=2775080 RepID=UPI00223AA884|nr:ABC transporter substrate-binding protein [Aestuariispira ectoiniformans]
MRLKSLIFAAAAMAFLPVAGQADEADWPSVTKAARGQTVYWNAWGGSSTYNSYIDWVGQRVRQDYGVKLVHVNLGDTAEAVRRVLAEKSTGRDEDGSIDLIWINGENFKAMKEADLLYGPFVENLPNFALVDTVEKPTTVLDFTVPTDGLESPWGMAQMIFIHDSARLKNPPKSMAAILAHARANPGRVTYPAPPDFTGSTFLKQALLELTRDRDALLKPAGDNFDTVTKPLWDYLDKLSPYLWHEGKEYPRNGGAMIQMLDDGAIDLAYSFNVGAASNAIAEGRLPESARSYVLDGGTIGNTHFVAIPFNAAHKEGAMVVANFLMSPEAQARKQNPDYWGEPTVLSMHRLTPADKALFDDLPRGVATLSAGELGRVLPEPHPSWMTKIEERWLTRYGS